MDDGRPPLGRFHLLAVFRQFANHVPYVCEPRIISYQPQNANA